MPSHDRTEGRAGHAPPERTTTGQLDDLAPLPADEQERQVSGGRTTVRDSNDKYANLEISR